MRTVPLRRLVASLDNGSWGDEVDADAGVTALCIRGTDFAFDKLRVDLRRAPMRSFDQRTLNRLKLHSGDIVLEKSGGGDTQPVGRSVLFDHAETAVATNFAARLRPANGVDSRYLVYVLRHLYDSGATARAIKQTTGIQNLDTEAWLTTVAPRPEEDEQRRIADFLDDRVSRIDRITAARREQTDDTQAAFETWWDSETRGLFSEYPVVPLRRVLVSIADGPFGSSLASKHYTDFGTRVIRLGNIGLASFRDVDRVYISDEYAESLSSHAVQAGDLVMAGLGDERWPLGRCAVVPDIGRAIVKADCYRIRLTDSVSHHFAAIAISSPTVRSRLAVLGRGATRARLNTEVAREAQLPLAPQRVQTDHTAEWSKRREQFDALRAGLGKSVHLLTEYKSSVITAAVTGELDVTTAGSNIPG